MKGGCLVLAPICATLVAQGPGPLQVGVEPPGILDLRQEKAEDWFTDGWTVQGAADPSHSFPRDGAWARKVAPLQGRPSVRIFLASAASPGRIPMLLAACRALRAQDPAVILYLAFDPAGAPIWDEEAWGAVQGGALLPQDLGRDPATWRDTLMQAQKFLPGRPWTLWLAADPGARLAELVGDGARLVLPAGGPGARLASQIPPGPTELEGGLGLLVLREGHGPLRQWRFEHGAWARAEVPAEGKAVEVSAPAPYDVGALLAQVRAQSLQARLKLRTFEADLTLDQHLQGFMGLGSDIEVRFRWFWAVGYPIELLQKEVLLNGVRANLPRSFRFPIIDDPTNPVWPVHLMLTERYHYTDGGSPGPGRRRILVAPVDANPQLCSGSMVVDEASGRILERRESRSGLPGEVKSEDAELGYGDLAPGFWTVVRSRIFQHMGGFTGLSQVQTTEAFSNVLINDPDFEAHQAAAVQSDGTMLIETRTGFRYFGK